MTGFRAAMLAVAALTCATTIAAAPTTPSITALRAHLLENKTGRLSADILAAPAPGLWNSIAGPHAASSALVVVEINGQPSGAYSGRAGGLPGYRVRLVAIERGRVRALLDAQQALPVLGEDGKVHVGFLIRPGGCAAIQLTATLIGPQAASAKPRRATVPMACGE